MREKQIEQKLVKAVRNAGGLCPKFVSPGLAGMPDRLILLPGRRLAFVEVKAPGEKPRLLQLHRHAQLRALGFRVHVLDDPAQIPEILEQVQAPVAPALAACAEADQTNRADHTNRVSPIHSARSDCENKGESNEKNRLT